MKLWPLRKKKQFIPDTTTAASSAVVPFRKLTKQQFLDIAAEYGANRFLASDLWYFRPREHEDDTEEIIRGNFELLKKERWIERNNGKAEAAERHAYLRVYNGERCAVCGRNKRAAEHNTEPCTSQGLLGPKAGEP